MNKTVVRMLKRCYGALYFRNWYWSNRLVNSELWPWDFVLKDDYVYVPGTEFKVGVQDNHTVLHARLAIQRICSSHGAEVVLINDTLCIRANGITVEIRESSDAQQFDEIIIRRAKEVTLPENCVVWDIGGNVGIAALYFAAMEKVQAVYTYEPFVQTREQMRRNLNLNPILSKKINVIPCGVEAKEQDMEIDYARSMSDHMSLYFQSEQPDSMGSVRERIHLLEAVDELKKIECLHPGCPILIKLDCEGSEHTIIPALVSANALSNVPIMTMETHFDDYYDIINSLESVNYTVFSFKHPYRTFGEIHASKPWQDER